MIYTPLTVSAAVFAEKAHRGQTDKGGMPYIFHLFHVAEKMDDEFSVAVALLHDILEDTTTSSKELEKRFGYQIALSVTHLTRKENEDYNDYIHRLVIDKTAVKVKIADLEHNLDRNRLYGTSNLSEEKISALYKKYTSALSFLQNLTIDF